MSTPFLKIFQLVFVVQHAVAIALEIRICDLFPEFLADALVLLGALQAAGAVATGALQTVLHHLDHFLILIEPNCHQSALPFPFLFSIPRVSRKRSTPLGVDLFWRRVRDSNPRFLSESLVFKTSSLNRSDNSPLFLYKVKLTCFFMKHVNLTLAE